jgi:hypothetical protein
VSSDGLGTGQEAHVGKELGEVPLDLATFRLTECREALERGVLDGVARLGVGLSSGGNDGGNTDRAECEEQNSKAHDSRLHVVSPDSRSALPPLSLQFEER